MHKTGIHEINAAHGCITDHISHNIGGKRSVNRLPAARRAQRRDTRNISPQYSDKTVCCERLGSWNWNLELLGTRELSIQFLALAPLHGAKVLLPFQNWLELRNFRSWNWNCAHLWMPLRQKSVGVAKTLKAGLMAHNMLNLISSRMGILFLLYEAPEWRNIGF